MTWSPVFTLVTPGPTSTTMPAPSWPRIAGNGAGERELVGVADARRLHLDQHLAGFRPVEIDLGHRERLALVQGDGSAAFHGSSSPRRKFQSSNPIRCHSGAPRSGEPGIHNPRPVDMNSGLPRCARAPE